MTLRSIALTLLVLCALPVPTQAQPTNLNAARRALAQYDLEGDATIHVIRQLGELLAHPPGLRQALEAGFLRDMAAADLLILDPSDAMRQRVARALGVRPASVLTWLRADLARAAVGPYRPAATEGLAALALRDAAAPDYQTAHGPRRDALLLAAVSDALQAPNPVARLSSLMPDPCASEAPCADALTHFEASGRRAVVALVEARAAVARLGEAAEGGDPFARSVAEHLPQTVAALDAAVLSPAPRLPQGTALPEVSGSEAVAHFDAVLLLSNRRLQLGYLAHVRVAEDGAVSLLPADVPLLPDTRSFRLPGGFRPVVSEIPALRRALPDLDEDTRVALGVAPEVPAHVMSRVFLSARAAGMEPHVLLARAADGGLRSVAFHGVVAGQRLPPSEMRVHVRLGGYAIASRQGAPVSLPRVRGDSGLHFDVDGLSHIVGERSPQSASLRFMSVVDSGPVLLAAFGLESASNSLTVVMP